MVIIQGLRLQQTARRETPQTALQWVTAIDKGIVDPDTILKECRLPEEICDRLLVMAYEKINGGVPCGA